LSGPVLRLAAGEVALGLRVTGGTPNARRELVQNAIRFRKRLGGIPADPFKRLTVHCSKG
jgi:hypothetical protein